MSIDDLLRKMEAAEHAFRAQPVLAAVQPGRRVRVRIAGIVCHLQVIDAPASGGWAILQPDSLHQARYVRDATRAEAAAFLELLPAVRLIAVQRHDAAWLALDAHTARTGQLMHVDLVEAAVQPFDTIIARWDGGHAWYAGRGSRVNPAIAAYLRDALSQQLPPDDLSRSGLTPAHRIAYTWNYQLQREAAVDQTEARLRQALHHAGGVLISYIEHDDVYTVQFSVDGDVNTSSIRKDDLTTAVAGICLSGQDARFDLTSLVSVLREAQGQHVPRTHMPEADFDDDDYRDW